MLRDIDFTKYTKIILATRYTDMRLGINGLAALVQFRFNVDVFDEGAIFLFCGKRRDRMKALVYEGTGFTLLYHRLNPNSGRFMWPMNEEEVMSMTPEQFTRLINGFNVDSSIFLARKTAKKRTLKN